MGILFVWRVFLQSFRVLIWSWYLDGNTEFLTNLGVNCVRVIAIKRGLNFIEYLSYIPLNIVALVWSKGDAL